MEDKKDMKSLYFIKEIYKSTLGRVPPLGRPRSVYKSDIECHFLEFWIEMAKWPWRSEVNDLHFQYQLRVTKHACLVPIWWMCLKSITSYYADNPIFLEF